MKKTVGFTLLICAIPLLAILAWYMGSVHSANAQADQFQTDAQNRKMVPVEFVVDVPKDTPADQAVYVSGSAVDLGNWDARGLRLDRKDDGKYHGSASLMSGVEYAYKVTRGTWGTVETDANAQNIQNRTVSVADAGPVQLSVAGWIDGGKTVPGRITAQNVKMEFKFPSKILCNERNLAIYLPPGYDKPKNKDVRYPVVYMQDGQNLFDESTSFAGVEWGVDEAMQKLIDAKQIQPAIIVGIYNAGEFRSGEFTPAAMSASGGASSQPAEATADARGDLYAKFVVEEVKPFIDKSYRTQPDRDHTSIAGASMGGLISLWTAKTHPDAFSKVAVLSPWLRLGDKKLVDVLSDGSWTKNLGLFIQMGDQVGDNYPGKKDAMQDARDFGKYLDSAGLKKDADYKLIEAPGVSHDERGYQKGVEAMLLWLLGKQTT
jgi:predicted alpha/beta superfamily hydrolase